MREQQSWKALDCLRVGDTLVVPSLDRLGRSLQDLIAIVAGLDKRGIGFRSLHEALDTTTPGGRLVFHSPKPKIQARALARSPSPGRCMRRSAPTANAVTPFSRS